MPLFERRDRPSMPLIRAMTPPVYTMPLTERHSPTSMPRIERQHITHNINMLDAVIARRHVNKAGLPVY